MAFEPSKLPTGKVIGRYAFVSVDDETDVDTDPTMLAVVGEVIFTCDAAPLPIQFNSGTEIIGVVPRPMVATFDTDGYIVAGGQRGVELLASGASSYNPSNFTWTASFNLREAATGAQVVVPSFSFQVPVNGTVSLPAVQPVGTEPGIVYVRGTDGRDAYLIAVQNGFTGTEAEWLNSLKASGTVPTDSFIGNQISTNGTATQTAGDNRWVKKADATVYETKANASATYETKTNAAASYETKNNAAATYETKANAAATYETKANTAGFETKANAAATYETKASAAAYETKLNAQATYETITGAANSYVGKADLDAQSTALVNNSATALAQAIAAKIGSGGGGGTGGGGRVDFALGNSTTPRPTQSLDVMVIFLTAGPNPPANAIPNLDIWMQV